MTEPPSRSNVGHSAAGIRVPAITAVGPVGVVTALAFIITGMVGVDALYALYTGRLVAASGVPHTETFTAAATHSWTDQQWLGQWIFFELYRVGGYAGLALVAFVVVSCSGVLLAWLMNRSGGHMTTAWATLAVTAILFQTAAVRTQTLAYPMFLLVLSALTECLHRTALRPQTAAVLPILVLWANIHGSVLLGAAMCAGCMSLLAVRFYRGRQLRQAVAASALALASAGTVTVTPYGLSSLHYYSSLIGSSALHTYVSDWQRLSVTHPGSWPFMALLALGTTAIVAARNSRRMPGRRLEVTVALALVVLGLYSGRYVVWAAFAVGYVGSVYGAGLRLKPPVRVRVAGHAAAIGVTVVAAVALAETPTHAFIKSLPAEVSAAAAETLIARTSAVVLADKGTASTMLWLYPETSGHVAFDIRYEQYQQEDLVDYFKFLRGRTSFACHYQMVALSHDEQPELAKAIRANSSWTPTYDGEDGIVAVRTPGVPCR